MPTGDPGNPNIQCVAHLHNGPHDNERYDLFYARAQIPVPTWDENGVTTAIYQIRGPYLLQPVAHYDYVPPTTTRTRRTGGLLGWLRTLT
jgi:hypothetical protein